MGSMRKNAFISVGAVMMAMALAAPSTAMAKTTIRFGAWMPASHVSNSVFLEQWAKDVEEKTEGRVEVDITYNPIGSPAQYLDFVRRGVLGAAYGVHAYQPGRFFLTQAAEMPFLADSSEVLSLAYWRTHKKLMEEHGEHNGVHLLGLFTHGPGVFFSRNEDVHSLEDFNGLRLRTGGGISHEVSKNLGVVPVQAPATSSYEMLSTGVVDSLMFPADSVPIYNLEDILRYGVQLSGGFYNTSFYIAMNQRLWDGLSEEDQEIISSLSGEYISRTMGKVWDDADLEGYKAMEASGMKVEIASGDLESDLREALSEIENNWVYEANKKGIDGRAILDTLRDEIDKARHEVGGY